MLPAGSSDAAAIASRLRRDPELRALVDLHLSGIVLGEEDVVAEKDEGCEGAPWFACLDLCDSFGLVLLVLVVLVLLSALIDLAIEALSRIEGVSGVLFEKVLKELSILGLLSFVLFTISSSASLPEELKETIELVHMVLFVAAIFYLVFVGFLVLVERRIMRRWTVGVATLAAMSEPERKELRSLTELPLSSSLLNVLLCNRACRESVDEKRLQQQLFAFDIICARYQSQGLATSGFLESADGFTAHLRQCCSELLMRFAELTTPSWFVSLTLYAITWALGQVAAQASLQAEHTVIRWNGGEGEPAPMCAVSYHLDCDTTSSAWSCNATRPSGASVNVALTKPLLYLCWALAVTAALISRNGLANILVKLRLLVTDQMLLPHAVTDGPSRGDQPSPHGGRPSLLSEQPLLELDSKGWARRRFPCCFAPVDLYRAQFWFGSPHFFIRAFQALLLGNALYCSFFVLAFGWSLPASFVPTFVGPPMHFCLFFSDPYLRQLTLAWSVGPLCSDAVIRDYLQRHPQGESARASASGALGETEEMRVAAADGGTSIGEGHEEHSSE